MREYLTGWSRFSPFVGIDDNFLSHPLQGFICSPWAFFFLNAISLVLLTFLLRELIWPFLPAHCQTVSHLLARIDAHRLLNLWLQWNQWRQQRQQRRWQSRAGLAKTEALQEAELVHMPAGPLGRRLLHVAAEVGNYQTVRMLLSTWPVDTLSTSGIYENELPVLLAQRCGARSTVWLLAHHDDGIRMLPALQRLAWASATHRRLGRGSTIFHLLSHDLLEVIGTLPVLNARYRPSREPYMPQKRRHRAHFPFNPRLLDPEHATVATVAQVRLTMRTNFERCSREACSCAAGPGWRESVLVSCTNVYHWERCHGYRMTRGSIGAVFAVTMHLLFRYHMLLGTDYWWNRPFRSVGMAAWFGFGAVPYVQAVYGWGWAPFKIIWKLNKELWRALVEELTKMRALNIPPLHQEGEQPPPVGQATATANATAVGACVAALALGSDQKPLEAIWPRRGVTEEEINEWLAVRHAQWLEAQRVFEDACGVHYHCEKQQQQQQPQSQQHVGGAPDDYEIVSRYVASRAIKDNEPARMY